MPSQPATQLEEPPSPQRFSKSVGPFAGKYAGRFRVSRRPKRCSGEPWVDFLGWRLHPLIKRGMKNMLRSPEVEVKHMILHEM